MIVKVCASVTCESLKSLQRYFSDAEAEQADLYEVRLDYLREEGDPAEIRKLTPSPLIATCRPAYERGMYQGTEEERCHYLIQAAEAGFDYVDVELNVEAVTNMITRVKETGAKTIASFHNFEATPNLRELKKIHAEATTTRADIVKVVTTAEKYQDNLTTLQLIADVSQTSKAVSFCMGELGILSRVLSPLFGSLFTYAAVKKGLEAAPGQLTIAEMREVYNLLGLRR
jgi:3-dehydroquinate dehydratase type I